MSAKLHISTQDQDFFESLSTRMAGVVDAQTRRAALHALIDELPMDAPALLAVRHPQTGEIAFEVWGTSDPAPIVYIIDGVRHRIYSPT